MYSWTCPICGHHSNDPEDRAIHQSYVCTKAIAQTLKAYAKKAVAAVTPAANVTLALTDADRAFLRMLRIDGNK